MNKIRNNIYLWLILFGFDPSKILTFIQFFPSFIKDIISLKRKLNNKSNFCITRLYPILNDKYQKSGISSGHYFHQDLLIAKKIFKNNPRLHVDIGSSIYGFISHVASFREIEVLDIRQQKANIDGIRFKKIDFMKELPTHMKEYCDSVSSLHAIEHFGLGRYGDKIDERGHIKGIDNMYQILEKKGKCYLSVPIGAQRIEFNAHRVFDIKYLIELFDNKFSIDSFSFVDDKGNLFENVNIDKENIKNNYGCYYGCGIFEMTRR